MTALYRAPSQVHDDWIKAIDSIRVVERNVQKNRVESLPSWTMNLTFVEVVDILNELVREVDLHFTLALIASIEGQFNRQLAIIVSKSSKGEPGRSLRRRFRRPIQRKKYIRFEDILEEWKRADESTKNAISKLKTYLNSRHWLAHGRCGRSFHYRTIPDPNSVFLLYDTLNSLIGFNE